MAIIKCKMCGGDIELTADKTFGTCEFCGNTMTLPKIDDDQRAAAFNRGNHFRRIGEFDKALAVYERIVREDDTDAEAHWCCALCRFGIEYVEDPATFEWLPTCHRASFDSFLEDVDYKAAVEYSDGITKRQYMKDGAKIAEVQRGILATSQNAEPYDVFICYKESDESGQRTRDSLMAQDIYYQLTEQGRKVFFARITLEDVVGTQYEPYIFAALNSARVMIVVGTKPEYLNAVWVKNEWSRFLAMMKKDRHKLLLPCYRDMDPYDMPEALSVLQSYDMGKIGFIQDLTRGIAKVLDADKKPEPVKETVVMQQAAAGANTAPLLKRAFMFLEDGDWNSANEYCEKVLDIDPECAQAYIGKLMTELRVKKQGDLQHQAEPFDGRSNYQKALRFSDEVLKATLKGYIEFINTRNENTRLENEYISAKSAMKRALREESYLEVAAMFERISGYKDSDKLAEECEGQAEIARKNSIYDRAKSLMNSDNQAKIEQAIPLFASIPGWRNADELKEQCPERAEAARKDSLYYLCRRVFTGEVKKTEENWKAAQQGFESIPKWRDADALAKQCAEQINKLKEEQARREKQAEEERIEQERRAEIARKEAERIAQRRKRIRNTALCAVSAIISLVLIFTFFILPILRYNQAMTLMDSGDYQKAAIEFAKAGKYKDARTRCFAAWDLLGLGESISAGDFCTVGLKTGGTVVAAGKNDDGECDISGWTDIVAISAGSSHTVGLKYDGTVVAVGDNESGQCNVSGWKDIVAISAGGNHTVGLKSDGTVVAVGYKNDGQCDVSGWTNIVAISTGSSHTVGLKSDGTVVATGRNTYGPCDVSSWTNIVAISAGGNHTVGLKSDGTVVAVGYKNDGQCDVSGWTNIVAISAGGNHTVGLKSDGTVVAVGWNKHNQCEVSDWADIMSISAGGNHTVGLKSDGTVVVVGSNYSGQCDVGGWSNIKTP